MITCGAYGAASLCVALGSGAGQCHKAHVGGLSAVSYVTALAAYLSEWGTTARWLVSDHVCCRRMARVV